MLHEVITQGACPLQSLGRAVLKVDVEGLKRLPPGGGLHVPRPTAPEVDSGLRLGHDVFKEGILEGQRM